MTPDGKVGTRAQLELRCKSQTLWTKKRLAHRRHKAIEKLACRDRPTSSGFRITRPTFPTGQSECGGKRFDASGSGS
jgi:hypothetical protein